MKNHIALSAKRATALLGTLGLLGAGIWSFDGRYAKAADVQELRQEMKSETRELKILTLENRLETLHKQLFELESIRARRQWTDFERARHSDIARDIEGLRRHIDSLSNPAKAK